jgi:glycosyltransferase involved in cell wall biosynthesis
MKITPKVSVIVPSYNHARFLRACLDSVISQTFSDWELILIDDGSSDNCVEIARSYSDPRIQVHQNETNLGTYGTQQRALAMAQGDYVAVLNSDDFWIPGKLEEQVKALDANPSLRLSYVLGWKADDKGQIDTSDDVHVGWPQTEVQDVLPSLLSENRILASGVMFRRQTLRFETTCRYSGDWVALLEQSRGGDVSCIPRRMNHWRMHANNTYVMSPNQLAEEARVRWAIDEVGERWATDSARLITVREGLAKNLINLVAISAYFYDRPGAIRAARTLLRYRRDKVAVRRAISAYGSPGGTRRHFWPVLTARGGDFPKKDLIELLHRQPAVTLKV